MPNVTNESLLLSFFASMLWQDAPLEATDHEALCTAAERLGFAHDDPRVVDLCELPPPPHEVDPLCVPEALAPRVLALASLAVHHRPSLAKYECLELLRELLGDPVSARLALDDAA